MRKGNWCWPKSGVGEGFLECRHLARDPGIPRSGFWAWCISHLWVWKSEHRVRDLKPMKTTGVPCHIHKLFKVSIRIILKICIHFNNHLTTLTQVHLEISRWPPKCKNYHVISEPIFGFISIIVGAKKHYCKCSEPEREEHIWIYAKM